MTDINRLLHELHVHRVDFIIIGGVAASAHGSARVTFDIDVVYSRTPENLRRLVSALAPLAPYLRGAPEGLPFEWSTATLNAGLNFTLTTTAGSIDLRGEVTGGGRYEDLTAHAIVVSLAGHDTQVLDLPWLIKTKRAAGRPKDLEAIAELELLQELNATNRRSPP